MRIVLEPGGLRLLPALWQDMGLGGTALVVSDENTYGAAGGRAAQILTGAGVQVTEFGLGDPVTIDVANVERIERHAPPPPAVLVAAGSGTVNDLVKLAATRLDRVFMACPTAPSMDGYTSAVAAVLADGVKITHPARPACVVVADTDVLAAAPDRLVHSGFADLLSKPICGTDWRLAALMRDAWFCPRLRQTTWDALAECENDGQALRDRDTGAIERLMRALLTSGRVMALAGESSPASGSEHLVSHYWDMIGHRDGLALDLHGRQVGVAAVVAASVYDALRARGPTHFDLARRAWTYASWAEEEERIEAAFGTLADGVKPEFRRKYRPWPALRSRLELLLDRWDEIWAELGPGLRSAGELRERLRQAGAPTTAQEIGRTEDDVISALRHGRYLRARYTVLDLAAELGLLDEAAQEIVQASGVS